MGADVTCRAVVTNGSIFFIYKDSNPNVGAKIETDGNVETWIIGWSESFEGFQIGPLLVPSRPEYFSNDFPTNNNYEILLIQNSDGRIDLLDLSSS
jgi:hypothetical protein